MQTLIVGADGQLGRELIEVFSVEGPTTGLTFAELDILDVSALRYAADRVSPDIIINAAAYTDVERAESERDAAFAVNETGARNVAELARERDIPTVYFSTDFVFDGSKREPYEADDPVSPRGVYAASKAAGEAATRDTWDKHFIIRTAWLYGIGGNNFVEKILRATETRPSLRVVDDEIGSPTYTRDLAEATRALARTAAYGTYHGVNGGQCSRFEFAQEILRLAGLTNAVEPCRANEFPSKAPRPAYSVLSNARLEEACGFAMPHWKDALQRFMQKRETIQ
ncbi:MAG: dTDP-4-dehydrorhamnose reductase [Candidatus Hydrogenedentes bacterium]|nr:dTDP-4-dehydrorhamnose reductase [Candidatus Hydrogenedentota bacterium]